jgi:peroxiredoxin
MGDIMNTQTPPTRLVVGDDAPDVRLVDHEGQTIAMMSLWQSQPRVLLFVRHFG